MIDFTKPWPLGLGDERRFITLFALVWVVGLTVSFDAQIIEWVRTWPEAIGNVLAQLTPYGESDWILWPSGVLFVVTALLALVVRWTLMRTMLWQLAGLYGFIFAGVGLPSLAASLLKRAIGRGRPDQYDAFGLWGLQPNLTDWMFQSFPSGHATTAFALAAVVGFCSTWLFYPALLLAAAIGLSRVTMNAHYLSDVLMGALLGYCGAYLVRWWFAKRGWVFERLPDGRIRARPMSSLRRYLALRRRGSAPAPQPSQP